MLGRLVRGLVVVCAVVVFLAGNGFGYEVPKDDSNVDYFYVFGPDGDRYLGAEDNELILYIDVPEAEYNDILISVYDPDTGGKRDLRTSNDNPWDTVTGFAVWGEELLDKEEFGAEEDYNQKYFKFGPYSKTQGEKIDNFYRFRVVVKALKGDDENLFKFKISPESAEAFSKDITFRLLQDMGEEMFFYPEIPVGTETIVVGNYDLDVEGGESTLYDKATRSRYRINDSSSGEWRETSVSVSPEITRRLEYVITKKFQKYANAGLKIKDGEGNLLPIYFKEKEVSVILSKVTRKELPPQTSKCNRFTFDATSSYDADSKELFYLWDFGDGTTSEEPVVTHIYEQAGTYIVTLSVTDESGLECNTAITTQEITINTPPEANFASGDLVCTEEEMTFDASQTLDNAPEHLKYTWDFGDGTTAEEIIVSKVWDKGGTYKVTLSVDDNSGTDCSIDTVEKVIKVNTPPVADAGEEIARCFSSSSDGYKVNFDASGSKDADRDDLTYSWNFGDGTEGVGKTISHVYEKDGEYEVTLTVTDDSDTPCNVDVDTMLVNIMSVPVAIVGDDMEACTGESVAFDGSSSYGAEGDELLYTWNFGDGSTGKGVTANHSYDKGGKYSVTLTVDNGKGTSCSTSTDKLFVDVNSPPRVDLKDAEIACIGKKVSFDASDSGDPDKDSLKYFWDFGDGTTAKGRSKISHKYAEGGTYRVAVTVDDNKGSLCSTNTDHATVKVNAPPVASLHPDHVCCVDDLSEFDGSKSYDPDNDALSYDWDFGDGAVGTGVKPTHVYKRGGTYKVVLRVADSSGTRCNSDTSSFKVHVNENPVSVIKIR